MGCSRLLVCCSVLLVLAWCLVVEGRLGCKSGFGCSHPGRELVENGSRKVSGLSEEIHKGLRPLDPRDGGNLVDWDLRWVPSGPDPLHHNGSPKKPQTP